MSNFCSVWFLSSQRAFKWKIRDIDPTPEEIKHLSEKQAIIDSTVASYVVWRRSGLMVATPIVFFSMIMGFVNLKGAFSGALTGVGNLLALFTGIDSLILFSCVVASVIFWSDLTKSSNILRYGWLVAFTLTMVPAFFPLEMLIDRDALAQADEVLVFLTKIALALNYVLILLPNIVSFPSGAVRAAVRVSALLPESSLAGWIMIICAPFYSLLVFLTLVVVTQVAGDFLLMIGALLLVGAPWVYMHRANLFVGLADSNTDTKIANTLRISGIVTLSGFFFIIVWALTTKAPSVKPICTKSQAENGSDLCLLTYGMFLRMILETIARILITTVVISDVIVAFSIRDWKIQCERIRQNQLLESTTFQALEEIFDGVEQEVHKGNNPDGQTTIPVAAPVDSQSVPVSVSPISYITSIVNPKNDGN